MISEGLRKAQEAIEERLREEGRPVMPRDLVAEIKKQDGNLKEIDLREAIWLLIGRGEIDLTWDRKLVSKDIANSYPVRSKPYAP